MTSEVRAFERGWQRPGLRWLFKAGATIALCATSVPAAADYNEGTLGDLSNSGLTPTSVSMALGNNIISGTTGQANGVIDRDYFTFTLAPGQQLNAIQVLAGTTSISGPDPNNPRSFIGIQSGNQVTVLPSAASAAGLLGWTHYGPSLIGTDILDDMGVSAAGSTGFTPPLGSGTYSVWIQEANVGSANYVFNFLVASVPEPSTWAMMLSGFGLIGLARRRQRRRQTGSGPSSERSLAI